MGLILYITPMSNSFVCAQIDPVSRKWSPSPGYDGLHKVVNLVGSTAHGVMLGDSTAQGRSALCVLMEAIRL